MESCEVNPYRVAMPSSQHRLRILGITALAAIIAGYWFPGASHVGAVILGLACWAGIASLWSP
jgi:hypothetical protein